MSHRTNWTINGRLEDVHGHTMHAQESAYDTRNTAAACARWSAKAGSCAVLAELGSWESPLSLNSQYDALVERHRKVSHFPGMNNHSRLQIYREQTSNTFFETSQELHKLNPLYNTFDAILGGYQSIASSKTLHKNIYR